MMLASFSENKIMMKFLWECMEMQTRMYAQRMWEKSNSMSDSVHEEPHQGIYQKLCDKNLEGAINFLKSDLTAF